MSKRRQIFDGRSKILFEGPEPGTLVQYFKDDTATRLDDQNTEIIGKGALNNRISEFFMLKLREIGVHTHLIRRINMREQLITLAEPIPITPVIRNIAAGSFAKRLGLEEGTVLPRSIVEFYYKDSKCGDPLVSEEHITAFDWARPHELDEMVTTALRVNDFMCGLFAGIGLKLIDFKLEFGRIWLDDDQRLIIIDEISPDTCRIWDASTNEKLGKERLRSGLDQLSEAYQEVATRLGVLPEGGLAELKSERRA